MEVYYCVENRCFTLCIPTVPDYGWTLNNINFWLTGDYPHSSLLPIAKELIWNTSKDGERLLKGP